MQKHTLNAARQSFHQQTRPVWEMREPLTSLAKAKAEESTGAAQGEQHGKPPMGSPLPAAWGGKGSHHRNPHGFCWGKSPDLALLKLCSWDSWDGNSSPPCSWEVKWWEKGSRSNAGRQRHIQGHPLCAGIAQPGVALCWTKSSCFEVEEIPWVSLNIIHHLVLPKRCCLAPVSCWMWEDLQTKRSSISCSVYQVVHAAPTTPSPQPAHTLAVLSRLEGPFQPLENLISWSQAGKTCKHWWDNSNKEVRKGSKSKFAPHVQLTSQDNILSGQVQD